MDSTRIKTALLNSMLSGRSSRELSYRLGFSYNQVRRWEIGEKQLRWDEFADLCEVLGLPLAQALERVFHYQPDEAGELTGFVGHLRTFFPLESVEGLAAKLHCHPSALKRYLKGEIFPDLAFVLAFMDLNRSLLARFVASLVPQGLAEFPEELRAELSRCEAEAAMPLAAAVEAALAVEDYQRLAAHDPRVVAHHAGCTPEEAEQAIQALFARGNIIRKPDGKFFPNYQTVNTHGMSSEEICRMLRYWSERGAMRFAGDVPASSGEVRSLICYRVAPASRTAMQRINEVLGRANAEILSILEGDTEPPVAVRALLLHAFNANDGVKGLELAPRSGGRKTTQEGSISV